MSNRIQGKQVYRMLFVSILLVFSLSTVVLAADSPSADDPTSDLYPIWYSLEEIYEYFRLTYRLLGEWADLFLPNIENTVKDIKSYLYYNEQSAAYYLYQIESALSSIADYTETISIDISDLCTVVDEMFTNQNSIISRLDEIITLLQNGSGSTDSSSPTDLTEVLEYLDTVTGLVGQTQVGVYALMTGLEQANTYLSQVSTKLDGVSTMVTKLNVLDSSLNDVLEYLETSTGLLGLIQVASDATNVKLEQTNNYLYQVSTKLDGVATMAISQNTANSYLLEISTTQQELDTTLSNIESALIYNETGVGRIMVALNENFLNRTSSIISTLTYNGGSVARYASALNENFLSRSSDIVANLTYNGASVARSVAALNENFLNRSSNIIAVLNTAVANQQELIDLVSDLEITTNVTVENIENIAIDVTNKAYEVFYITDSDGNKQNISDFSGDVLSVGGRLLNFFFKVAFDDALDSVDSAIDDMTEFYLDDSVVLDGGGSLWE